MAAHDRKRIERVRVLVERNKGRAGYSFWRKGIRIARWWHNHPWIEQKMGPKRPAQWWSALRSLDTGVLRLIQPLNTPVEDPHGRGN